MSADPPVVGAPDRGGECRWVCPAECDPEKEERQDAAECVLEEVPAARRGGRGTPDLIGHLASLAQIHHFNPFGDLQCEPRIGNAGVDAHVADRRTSFPCRSHPLTSALRMSQVSVSIQSRRPLTSECSPRGTSLRITVVGLPDGLAPEHRRGVLPRAPAQNLFRGESVRSFCLNASMSTCLFGSEYDQTVSPSVTMV